jgi:serine/threonine protein kinase
VKSTKSNAGERERADLLRELAIMQQLGAHPNVVTLLGCCTEQGKLNISLLLFKSMKKKSREIVCLEFLRSKFVIRQIFFLLN